MELPAALEIMRKLAQGINPVSGERFPQESPYNHAEIIRALYVVLARAPKVKKTPEEKSKENIARGMPRNMGLPWTDEARRSVAESYRGGRSLDELADSQQRTKGAIVAELLRQQVINVDQANAVLGSSRFSARILERRQSTDIAG